VAVVIVPVHSAVQGRVQGGALLDVVTTGEVIPTQLRVAVAGDDVPALRVVRLTLDPAGPTGAVLRASEQRWQSPP
jgi:hypothetical protein